MPFKLFTRVQCRHFDINIDFFTWKRKEESPWIYIMDGVHICCSLFRAADKLEFKATLHMKKTLCNFYRIKLYLRSLYACLVWQWPPRSIGPIWHEFAFKTYFRLLSAAWVWHATKDCSTHVVGINVPIGDVVQTTTAKLQRQQHRFLVSNSRTSTIEVPIICRTRQPRLHWLLVCTYVVATLRYDTAVFNVHSTTHKQTVCRIEPNRKLTKRENKTENRRTREVWKTVIRDRERRSGGSARGTSDVRTRRFGPAAVARLIIRRRSEGRKRALRDRAPPCYLLAVEVVLQGRGGMFGVYQSTSVPAAWYVQTARPVPLPHPGWLSLSFKVHRQQQRQQLLQQQPWPVHAAEMIDNAVAAPNIPICLAFTPLHIDNCTSWLH